MECYAAFTIYLQLTVKKAIKERKKEKVHLKTNKRDLGYYSC